MSFILDALKKSESDRQRHSGPALFEVRVAPPRTGLPNWAVAVVALLVVNLGIVMWMLLRRPHAPPASAAAPTTAQAVVPAAVAPIPAPVAAAAAAAPPVPGALSPSPTASAPAVAAAVAGETPGISPHAAAAGTPLLPAAPIEGAADSRNPQDYAPALDQPGGTGGVHVRRATADGVPLYQEAAASPSARLPQLRLDLHVFAARPEDRFVMINMHKLREGESLPEGVKVDNITPDGAVLSYNGSKFLLPRE